jgi:Domain of unknown function (DUF4123)
MAHRYSKRIQDILWPRGSGADVWAILDGARDRRISFNILNSYQNSSCLYAGNLPPELERVAPYLVQLDYHDRFTEQLIEEGWGNSWGIYLKGDLSMQKLRRHLRTLLMVRDHSNKRLLFRYYDPRVLRVYLPTCFTDELQTVFGPIEKIWTENAEGDSLQEFRVEKGKLLENAVALGAEQVAGGGR